MPSEPRRTVPAAVSLTLPFAASSAARVRDELQAWLSAYGLPVEVVDDARLVATELVGNAVRHADPVDDGLMLVNWHEERGNLAFSVSDGGGPGVPHQRSAPADAVGGRGLNIVDALSLRWWIERRSARHTVPPLVSLGPLVPLRAH